MCLNTLRCGHAFSGQEWVCSNGDRLPQTRAEVTLLGNIPQKMMGVVARGKAGQVLSCGNGLLSLSFLPEESQLPFSTWPAKV